MSGRRAGRPLLPGPTDDIRCCVWKNTDEAGVTHCDCTERLSGVARYGVHRKGAARKGGGSVGWLRATQGLRVASISGFRRVAPEPSSSTDRRGCNRGETPRPLKLDRRSL